MNARAGFALPLALVAVALVSVSLLALMRAESVRVRRVATLQAEWRADLAVATAEARVAHLLVTEPLSTRAITVAPEGRGAPRPAVLDGRPYALAGVDAAVRLQDEAGLVNLNATDSVAVARLLRFAEAPDPDALAARLADYVDGDDLTRADGAEKLAYARAGAPAPFDRTLSDPLQAFAVLGWRALDAQARRVVRDNAAALSPAAWFNPNTATIPALRAVLGIDANAAAMLIAQREAQSLLTRDEVMALTGAADVRSQIRATTARSLLLTVNVTTGPSQESYVYAYRLRIAEVGSQSPVLIDRTEAPTRVISREWTRANDIGVLDTLPEAPRLRAP